MYEGIIVMPSAAAPTAYNIKKATKGLEVNRYALMKLYLFVVLLKNQNKANPIIGIENQNS
jgi:hypothetical protein